MKHEKISSHHLERKAILYVRQSSAHQVLHGPRERRPAICDARPAGDARLVLHRDDRRRAERAPPARRPWPVRGGRRRAGGRRRDGRRGLPGQGRCGRGAGSVALCPQQSRLAAADRDVPGRRHRPGRPGGGICAAPGQRPSASRFEGKPRRVRARSGSRQRSLSARLTRRPVAASAASSHRWPVQIRLSAHRQILRSHLRATGHAIA